MSPPTVFNPQVLLRRTKNNPVLVGEPGVGKTAVVEGIAQLLASPHAPPGWVPGAQAPCGTLYMRWL